MQNCYLPEGEYISNEENTRICKDIFLLEQAKKEGKILEGRAVVCDKNMNLTVNLGGDVIGFIPKEEAVFSPDGSEIKDIAVLTRVGKSVCFHVKDIITENGRKKAILSRLSAQKECYENFLSTLNCGDIIPCRITHTEHFGAFADIGCGMIALLPIDCISVSRINHPNERFPVGTPLRCIIKQKDEQSKRIYISTKELFGTWEENCKMFTPGQTVSGIIRSVEEYGIFIELAPNLAGLAEYSDGITPGTEAAVYIKSMNPEKMKIKLVIVSSLKEPTEKKEIRYFIPENEKHIDFWQYSPKESRKYISTVFGN